MILFSTLGRYLSMRFLRTIAGVFAVLFLIIFIGDFVELLRRASDTPGASASRAAMRGITTLSAHASAQRWRSAQNQP